MLSRASLLSGMLFVFAYITAYFNFAFSTFACLCNRSIPTLGRPRGASRRHNPRVKRRSGSNCTRSRRAFPTPRATGAGKSAFGFRTRGMVHVFLQEDRSYRSVYVLFNVRHIFNQQGNLRDGARILQRSLVFDHVDCGCEEIGTSIGEISG